MLDFRFPTALQMVLSVAVAEKLGVRSTSAVLAAGLEANPSFIRKLMVPLTKNGIIVSTLGRNIYLSVIDDKRIWAARPEVPARCLVSANACWYFKSVVNEAEEASLEVLARHTVADALAELERGDKRACAEYMARAGQDAETAEK